MPLPALIMLTVTVGIVGLLSLPMLLSPKSGLLNFYWTGFWGFIAMIAAVAGAEQTLLLAGYDVSGTMVSMKSVMTLCFVLFVVFAWFRLSATALVTAAKRIIR